MDPALPSACFCQCSRQPHARRAQPEHGRKTRHDVFETGVYRKAKARRESRPAMLRRERRERWAFSLTNRRVLTAPLAGRGPERLLIDVRTMRRMLGAPRP